VAVRSPHAARLAALLTKQARAAQRSVEVVREGGNRLSVYGSTCADVGETAFRHGIVVHQLADEIGDMGPGAGAAPAAPSPVATQPVTVTSTVIAERRHTLDPLATTEVPESGVGEPPASSGPDQHSGEPSAHSDAASANHAVDGAQAAPMAPSSSSAHADVDAPTDDPGVPSRPLVGVEALAGDAGLPSARVVGRDSSIGEPGAAPPVPVGTEAPHGSPGLRPPNPTGARTTRPLDACTTRTPDACTTRPLDAYATRSPDARTARIPDAGTTRNLDARGARTLDALPPLPPPISVRPAPSPLRPLRYEIRRAAGIGTGFLTGAVVLVVSAVTAVVLGLAGQPPGAQRGDRAAVAG
ncbi:ABC transporter, partial [Streptomyces sp. NPDC093509]